jgi:signal transduction histidine kinase
MDALIQDLLAFSQLARAEIRLEAVNLTNIVDAALRELAPEVERVGAKVQVEGSLPTVPAHASTLRQVLTNLLSNAIKFTAPGVKPQVRIRSERREDIERLWIEDNGIGIAPEYHARIFMLFERLHKTEEYPGTGIGLAIVSRAMERMGGRIGVESAPGQGSRFWIEFPRKSSERAV